MNLKMSSALSILFLHKPKVNSRSRISNPRASQAQGLGFLMKLLQRVAVFTVIIKNNKEHTRLYYNKYTKEKLDDDRKPFVP